MIPDLPVKIIRLKTSEDIVAFVEEDKNVTTLYSPMTFSPEYDTETESNSLYINFWLPINMIENNEITIKNENILFIVDASEDFSDYYTNLITDSETAREMDDFSTSKKDVNIKLH